MRERILQSRVGKFVITHRVISAIFLIVVIGLIFLLRPKPTTPPEVVTVQKGTIEQTISGTGVVDSKTSVNLSFLAGGKVTYLGVKKGDTVTPYQTIATLDVRSVQKNIESTLIDYSKQRIEFDSTREGFQNRTPEQALSDAMRDALRNNQYDLNKTILSVEIQELARQNAILTTPIGGVVTRADIQSAGVTVGATTTFTVADPENIVFNIDIDEADIGQILVNQKARIVLDAYPDEVVELPVSQVDFASHLTSTGGTAYTVQLSFPKNSLFKYRIGMSGDAEIITKRQQNVLIIPISSLFQDEYVLVKNGDKFDKRKVVLGIQNDTQVEVKEGLKKGEIIAEQPLVADPKLEEEVEAK